MSAQLHSRNNIHANLMDKCEFPSPISLILVQEKVLGFGRTDGRTDGRNKGGWTQLAED
jgi:hypothetical protein